MIRERLYRKLVILAAVLVVCSQLTQCTSQANQLSISYAYVTKTELVAMQSDRVIGRAPVQYDISYGDLVTTVDGKYFAVLSTSPSSGSGGQDTKLTAIDAATGQVQNRDCPTCESLAQIGDSRVIAKTSEGVLRFDLATSTPPTRFNPLGDYRGELRLLSGTGGLSLAATPDLSDPNKEAFYLVSSDGSSRQVTSQNRLETDTSGAPARYGLGRSAATTLSDGESRFAVSTVFSRSDLPCAIDGHVVVFSSKRQDGEDAGLFQANHANIAPGVDGALMAFDLWWDTVGDLHAIILNSTCGSSGPGSSADSVSEWRYHDGRWSQISNEPARAVRQLDDRTRIVLRPSSPLSSGSGDLYFEQDRHSKQIAQGVILTTTKTSLATSPVDPCHANSRNCTTQQGNVRQFYTAPVPSMCEHPAGTLADGSLPGIPESQGFVTLAAKENPQNTSATLAFGDLTGHGPSDAAVVFDCSQGGVGWPPYVALYTSGPTLLGAIDLGKVTPAEHAQVEHMRIQDGSVMLTWLTFEGAGTCFKKWSAKLRWDGKNAVVDDLIQASKESGSETGC